MEHISHPRPRANKQTRLIAATVYSGFNEDVDLRLAAKG